MKQFTKILLITGGLAAVACATYYIFTHTSVHEVGEAEDNNIPVDTSKDSENSAKYIPEELFDEGDTGLPFIEPEPEVKKYDIPPYEISQETFVAQEPKFEKQVLWWDTELNEFSNELEDILYDKNTILGSWNIKRFLDDDEMTFMYIRNENKQTDYELVK